MKIKLSDPLVGTVILGLTWLAFVAVVGVLLTSCASTEKLRFPTHGCDSSPEPLTGFLGQVKYPEDLDLDNAVYCGCAFSCPDIGPAILNISIGECIADVPDGCATRTVFCPAPDPDENLL